MEKENDSFASQWSPRPLLYILVTKGLSEDLRVRPLSCVLSISLQLFSRAFGFTAVQNERLVLMDCIALGLVL